MHSGPIGWHHADDSAKASGTARRGRSGTTERKRLLAEDPLRQQGTMKVVAGARGLNRARLAAYLLQGVIAQRRDRSADLVLPTAL